jgi:hypothetical protein
MRSRFILIFPALLALLPIGCATMAVNFTEATSPNFWAIENGCQTQLTKIQSSVQAHDITFTLGDGLKTNDEIIRRLNHQYRDNSAGATDLNTTQYAFLNRLLKDNDKFLADAVENPDDWEDAFSGQDDYIQYHRAPANQDFGDAIQRGRFIVYLNMRIKEDIDKALSMAQSGQLSIDQAQELQSNLNDVQGKAVEDYYANNSLDLTGDQIFQLRRMLADSYQALNIAPAPTYYGGGSSYNTIPSNSWASNPGPIANGGNYYQAPAQTYYNAPSQGSNAPRAPAPTPTRLTNSLENNRLNNYGTGSVPSPAKPTAALPTSTPVPAAPTATPIPPASAPMAPAPPTNTPVMIPTQPPAIIVPTDTPVPPPPTDTPIPIPTDTPVPAPVVPTPSFDHFHDHSGDTTDYRFHFHSDNQPSNNPAPAAPAPTAVPTQAPQDAAPATGPDNSTPTPGS